jgi:hypothetical protein
MWAWRNKTYVSLAAIFSGMGIYRFIVTAINRKVDAKIFRSIQEHGPMFTEEVQGRVGESFSRTETRLWDLYQNNKIDHSTHNQRGKDQWFAVATPQRQRNRG